MGGVASVAPNTLLGPRHLADASSADSKPGIMPAAEDTRCRATMQCTTTTSQVRACCAHMPIGT